MDVRVLGPVEVWLDGTALALGGPRQRALLALLTMRVPHAVPNDVLIEGLWGDRATSGARSTLQTHVSNLRQVLGDVVVHERGGYRLMIDRDHIDANRFESELHVARTHLVTAPERTAERLRRALESWRGRPYGELIDIADIEAEARRLEELRLEAVELRVEADLASGHAAALVAELEGLAEEHPIRERFRAQHMLALYRSGRQADALRAYRRTETFLGEELGVEPSSELSDLELRILQHDPTLLVEASRTTTQRLATVVTALAGADDRWHRDPTGAAEALETHDRVLRSAIEAEDGRVCRHTGSGMFAVFPDVRAAVRAAEGALRGLADTASDPGAEPKVCVGIDVGDVESTGGDVTGPPLTRAARLCAVAHGGQVLISGAAQTELSADAPSGVQIRHLGEVSLRGMAAPEPLSQLVFPGLPSDFGDLHLRSELDVDPRLEMVTLPGYELRARLGDGTTGTVWRAYQPSIGREVAVKVIRPELASQPSFVRTFEAEARTVARLAHPHIVPLIDFWRDGYSAYLVVALLDGGSLAAALEDAPVDQRWARQLLGQVAAALDHAHSQGVVHGDLRAENVLLDGAGNAYLTDFRIAAPTMAAAGPQHEPRLDSEAPEQASTGPSERADVYSLGVLARRMFSPSAALEPVLARATATRPGDRHPTASALADDVEGVLGTDAERASAPTVVRNPFKGLRPFDEADAADFFGRDELVSSIASMVSRHRWVTVVGPSGSGKSSAVRAGLIPTLSAAEHDEGPPSTFAVFTPGADPLRSLAEAVSPFQLPAATTDDVFDRGLRDRLDGELVLVIDQFEELYTLTTSAVSRDAFIALVTGAVADPDSGIRVVATLRADFYDRPLATSELGRLVSEGLVTVLPPSRAELVEMVVRPSEAVGFRWEPGLPHRIADEVASIQGGLPLLQYALTELIERRSGSLVTTADYDRSGGVTGALATRAEATYAALSPAQQDVARHVMLRLVSVDEGTVDTRRRVRRSELESQGFRRPDLDAVVDALVAQRLLVADRDPTSRGPTVEVAHEALLRAWPRLRAWVDDARESLIAARRLRAAFDDWEASGRHVDYLLTGSRLTPFVDRVDAEALPADEADFYRASVEHDDAARSSRRRRRRLAVTALTVAALVTGSLALIAARQADRARDQAARAEANERRAVDEAERATTETERADRNAAVARSRELSAAAINVLDDDAQLSLLLGLEAIDRAADPGDVPIESVSALHEAVRSSRARFTRSFPSADPDAGLDAVVSPDGSLIAATDLGARLEIWNGDDGATVWSFDDPAGGGWFWNPHFSPDSSVVVVAYTRWWSDERRTESAGLVDGVYLFDARTGAELSVIEPRTGCAWIGLPDNGAFADDGRSVMTIVDPPIDGGEEGCYDDVLAVQVVDVETAEVRSSYDIEAFQIEGASPRVAVSVDSTNGLMMISESAHEQIGRTRVIDASSGEALWQRAAVTGRLDPAGATVALSPGTGQRGVDLVDARTGELAVQVAGTDGVVADLAFVGDGRRLLTGAPGGAVTIWDVATGELLLTLTGSDRPITRVSSDADGRYVVGSSDSGPMWSWDASVQPLGEVMAFDFGPAQVAAWGIDTGGGRVAAHGFAGQCPDQFWYDVVLDATTGEVVSGPFHDAIAQTVALTDDGSRLVHQLADPSGPAVPCSEQFLDTLVVRHLASDRNDVVFDGLCRWFDELSECAAPHEGPFAEAVNAVEISRDGRYVVAGGRSSTASLWELATGAQELTLGPFGDRAIVTGVAIHPDNSLIAVAVHDVDHGRLLVYDIGGDLVAEADLGSQAGQVAFDPTGRQLIAGGAQLTSFDTSDWQPTWEPVTAHDGGAFDLDVSPDGTRIVTVGFDGFVRVWSAMTAELVHAVPLGDDAAKAVSFVDDRHVAVGTQAGLVAVLTTDIDELLGIARSRLVRELTDAECRTYLHTDGCPGG